MNIVLWVAQVILAAAYLFAGQMKAFQYEKAKAMLKWPGDLPKGLVAFIGTSELLGGLGLILPGVTGVLPWLTPLAATGLAVIMFLATLFHVRRREYQALPVTLTLAALCVFVAYGRWQVAPL